MALAKVPMNCLMDKENVIHTHPHTHTQWIHIGILLSHEEELNYAICRKMDEIGDLKLNEINQNQKGKCHVLFLLGGT
jgi:hypothetical protein